MGNLVRGFLPCVGLAVMVSCGSASQVDQSAAFPSSSVIDAATIRGDSSSASGASDLVPQTPMDPVEVVAVTAGSEQSFTAGSAAVVASQRVSQTQHLLYADDAEIRETVQRDTTVDGRRALRALVDEDLVPVRNALATAPPATTWFAVRPLSVSVPVIDEAIGGAHMTVWSIEVFSRVGVTDPETMFFETDVGLVWDGSRWLLDSYVVRPGPVARLAREQYPVTAPELVDRLGDHRLVDPITLEAWGVES